MLLLFSVKINTPRLGLSTLLEASKLQRVCLNPEALTGVD